MARRIHGRWNAILGNRIVRAVERDHHFIALEFGVVIPEWHRRRTFGDTAIDIERAAVAWAVEAHVIAVIIYFAVRMRAFNIDTNEQIRFRMNDENVAIEIVELQIVRPTNGFQVRIIDQVDWDFANIRRPGACGSPRIASNIRKRADNGSSSNGYAEAF